MAIVNETIDERPIDCEFTGGRMFYLVNTTIYFSQVMEGDNVSFLGKCYQKNDPTSEQLSDLLATDGGTIPVNDADVGVALSSTSNGIIVLCRNGVWLLSGPDTGFTATSFSLTKITDNGCVSAQSIVRVGDQVFYWGDGHIHVLQPNQFGVLKEESIVSESIETFYTAIPSFAKEFSSGFYNCSSNEVEWFYSSRLVDGTNDLHYAKDLGINYNLKSAGFFTHTYQSNIQEVVSLDTSLVGGLDLSTVRGDGIFYISFDYFSSASGNFNPSIGKQDDITYQDFGTNYPVAFIETGFETLGKPSNKKVALYITTHFKKTEENFIADGFGGLKLDLQSGCQLRSQWDWNDTSANGRFSPFQQAYRFRRTFIPSVAGPFDSGETVITTKNKVLGRGNSLSLRFEQEVGKDMQLLGYTIQFSLKGKM